MLKVLECFAGIGAASKALENLGIEHEIVDAVEIDKSAIKAFNAIHGTNFEPQDITEWDKAIEVDLLMHGSPCTDFSVSGLQAGGDKKSGTRSSLMYESIRIIEKLRPRYAVWENVKNLLSKKHRHNFDAYLETMESIGYTNYYQVLNAKDYGVPQNRERVFTVSVLDGMFKFPEPTFLHAKLEDVLEVADERYFLDEKHTSKMEILSKVSLGCKQVADLHYYNYDKMNRVYSPSGCSPALETMTGGNREPKILVGSGVRRLTERECWRLMGFSDSDVDRVKKTGVSRTQMLRQAGNSIVVDVLMAIFKELFKDGSSSSE